MILRCVYTLSYVEDFSLPDFDSFIVSLRDWFAKSACRDQGVAACSPLEYATIVRSRRRHPAASRRLLRRMISSIYWRSRISVMLG